jgi:hypothetical protein
MRTIKLSPVVYELLLEKSKKEKYKSVELYLDKLARSREIKIIF